MVSIRSSRLALIVLGFGVLAIMATNHQVEASPAIAGHDLTGVCIRNCAQCKKMYGPWFEGQLCADSCVRLSGKMIPDCEDVESIYPFINKLE